MVINLILRSVNPTHIQSPCSSRTKKSSLSRGERYIIYLWYLAVKHINKWKFWVENFPHIPFFLWWMPYKKGPGVSVLAIGDMFSANGGKNRPNTVLSGEMVTFLLSQAVSILILIICRHPPGYTPSEINILQQRLRAGEKDTQSPSFCVSLPDFYPSSSNIIIFCHVYEFVVAMPLFLWWINLCFVD